MDITTWGVIPWKLFMQILLKEKMRWYVRGNWAGEIEETWGNAVVTKAVAVSEMHQWLKENPDAFAAAIR